MRFALKHAALVTACMAAFPAYATNGYFLPGAGYRSQGMGGVGIAYGRDSLSIAANPANAVNTGMRGDIGFGVFNPERSAATGTGAGGVASPFGFNGAAESDSKYFIVPEMGFTMPLDDKIHAGMAVVGNGGMNTTYPQNFFIPGGSTDMKLGVDMMQLLVPLTAAYKVNEDHAIGASLVLAETRFRAYGIPAFGAISTDAAHLTNVGFDYSYGAGIKLGWLGDFMDDRLTVGLTYASKTYMTKFDKYRGLFAEQGDFDVPANYGIGIAFKPVKNLVLAADVLRIEFGEIAAIGNRGPSAKTDPGFLGISSGFPCGLPPGIGDPARCLGNDLGLGFGWENQTVYKLGVQYGVNNKLQVRAGFNYGETPIPDDQVTFNTLAPATVEKHYSVGFTYRANENLEVTGTYVYAAPNNQRACNQNIVECVDIGMHQNVFGLSLGWVLDPGAGSLDEYGETEWAGINFDGWYGGFSFGQSRYQDVDAPSENTRSEGWKVYGGYQFNRYLALEGGYVNLNDMTATDGTLTVNVDTDGWTLGAVLSYPITDKLSVMGKVGAAYLLSDINAKNGAAATVRSGDDSYEPNYGVGVSYALLDNLSLRAEWERFDGKSFTNGVKGDIDLMSAGIAMKF